MCCAPRWSRPGSAPSSRHSVSTRSYFATRRNRRSAWPKHARARAIRLLYGAEIYRAGQAWNRNDVGLVRDILNEQAGYTERGFEWGYLDRLCSLSGPALSGHDGAILSTAFSRDGSLMCHSQCRWNRQDLERRYAGVP